MLRHRPIKVPLLFWVFVWALASSLGCSRGPKADLVIINGPEPDEDWKIPLQVEVLAPGALVEFPNPGAHDYPGTVRVGLSYPSVTEQPVSVRVTWQACSQTHCEAPMTVTLESTTP